MSELLALKVKTLSFVIFYAFLRIGQSWARCLPLSRVQDFLPRGEEESGTAFGGRARADLEPRTVFVPWFASL